MERCNRGYEEGNNETEAKKFDNQRRKKRDEQRLSGVRFSPGKKEQSTWHAAEEE